MRRTKATESEIQKASFQAFAAVRSRINAFLFHPPNGGGRDAREAAILQGQGVVAGVPDIVALWKGGCGGIEMKTGNGKQKTSQKRVQAEFERLGIPYVIGRSVDDTMDILGDWGVYDPTPWEEPVYLKRIKSLAERYPHLTPLYEWLRTTPNVPPKAGDALSRIAAAAIQITE